MRLKKSTNQAEEEIIALQNEGYMLLNLLKSDYTQKKESKTPVDHQKYKDQVSAWGKRVTDCLQSIFPTLLEVNQFLHPAHSPGMIAAETDDDYHAASLRVRLDDLVKGLDRIRQDSLARYTDLPLEKRLYVENIDSFKKVRDINPAEVKDSLNKNGYFDKSEEEIQLALEAILNEMIHKKDWGGECNDLYTSNIVLNGIRRSAAFLLKGNGLKINEMRISDCGKNGDQLVRLFEAPADIYFIQYVGNVSEAVIKDVEGKVAQLATQGKSVRYCIMNGQDTARLLQAYGFNN